MREERLNSAWLDYGVWLLYVAFASPFLFFFATWGFVGQLIAIGITYSLTEQLWYRYQRRRQLKRLAYQQWLEEREGWEWFFNEGQYILQGLEPPSQSQQPAPVEPPPPLPKKKPGKVAWSFVAALWIILAVLLVHGEVHRVLVEVETTMYALFEQEETDPHQYPVDSRFSIIP